LEPALRRSSQRQMAGWVACRIRPLAGGRRFCHGSQRTKLVRLVFDTTSATDRAAAGHQRQQTICGGDFFSRVPTPPAQREITLKPTAFFPWGGEKKRVFLGSSCDVVKGAGVNLQPRCSSDNVAAQVPVPGGRELLGKRILDGFGSSSTSLSSMVAAASRCCLWGELDKIPSTPAR